MQLTLYMCIWGSRIVVRTCYQSIGSFLSFLISITTSITTTLFHPRSQPPSQQTNLLRKATREERNQSSFHPLTSPNRPTTSSPLSLLSS